MNPDCPCELAGWCTRHNVQKATRLIELCKQRGDYWDAWESNRGPGQNIPAMRTEPKQEPPYNAWAALHYYPVKYRHDWSATRAKRFYRAWVASIPNSKGCGCRKKWAKLDIAFDFSAPRKFFDCSVVGHNTVNAALGRPVITFDDAYAIWWPK